MRRRPNRRRRIRPILFLGAGAFATVLALAAYSADVFERLEEDTIDARFALRGASSAPSDLLVVAIDDVTFSDLQLQWPFPRSVHGRLVDRIAAGRPKAIAYDIQFTEPTVAKEDNALIEAIGRARGKVVLVTTEVDEQGRSNVFGGESVLRQIGARSGNGLMPADNNLVIRRMPYAVDGLKSFAVLTAETALGRTIDADELGGERAWIDFVGPPGTIRHVSFSDVLEGRVSSRLFAGKVVVVGPSAPSLQDVHPTSTSDDEWMSGAEIQANAISTALQGFPLQGPERLITVLLVVALGLAPPVGGLLLPALRALALSTAVGIAFAVAVQVAFELGLVVDFVYPALALVVSAVATLGIHYLIEAFERVRVRDTFARFVPESVVDEALARADGLRLGGVRMAGTCMFTDLRGFTTFSEKLPPDQVIEILNRYLSEMSDAILQHGGTLVSYLGDGIFAVFGAPIEQPDHADRALQTALEMLEERLPRFNQWLRDQGFEEVRMGIGLNSGLFMSGNVGSERRLEYTAIGDTANTASRLEGMTKGTPYPLFLGESTWLSLHHLVDDLVCVGDFEVRGRQSTVRLWSLARFADGAAPASLDREAAVAE